MAARRGKSQARRNSGNTGGLPGWAWLVLDGGTFGVVASHDADNPLVGGATPLAVLDVWEHAYYLDHRNNRKAHIDAFLDHLIDWDFVASNLAAARKAA